MRLQGSKQQGVKPRSQPDSDLVSGVNQPAFFRTTGLGSWAWAVSRAVMARPSVWANLPASSAVSVRTCGAGSGCSGQIPRRRKRLPP